MANSKISALTAATTPLAGTEVLPIVQSSTTVKVSVDNLTAGKTVTADKFYAPSTGVTPVDARRTVANNTCLAQIVDSPSTSNCNYLITGIDTTGGTVGYASGGAFVSTGANGTGTARSLILHTYGNNDIVFARQNTQIGSVSANGFKPIATKGVDFSANTPAAGMTSQLLNWYEEGTFQPSWSSTGASFTYDTSYRHGTYVRIGRIVTFSIYISTSSAPTGTLTNPLTVTGLPFTSANTDNSNTCAVSIGQLWQVVWLAGANAATASVPRNSTSVQLRWETSNSNSSSFRADVLNAGAYVLLSGSYFV